MAYGENEALRARRDFPALEREMGERMAFLDGPAGTQVPRSVIDAIAHTYERSNANTGGYFATSVETDALVESSARRRWPTCSAHPGRRRSRSART